MKSAKAPRPERLSIATQAVHGRSLFAYRGAVAPPIYQTSTYRFNNSKDAILYSEGDPSVYVYSRYHNPTVREVEDRLALMGGGEQSLLFSSGMAAITSAILSRVHTGDEIISTPGLYGGTYRWFRDILPGLGITVKYVDPEQLEDIPRLFSPRTRIVYFETPTNPTLGIVDMKKLVSITRKAARTIRGGVSIMIDNTFGTVLNQRPFDYGVDVVIESGTKYLGGHSDILAGVVTGSKKFIKGVHTQLKYYGGAADPFAAFLLLRSLKTFELRVQQQNRNALALAKFLSTKRNVARVLYPGLPSHPQHRIARKQMIGYGGMVAIELRGGVKSAVRVADALRIAVNAMSLGGVETLVSIPVYSSHINMNPAELKRQGVSPGMLRISVGVEGIDDLKSDFAQAIARL